MHIHRLLLRSTTPIHLQEQLPPLVAALQTACGLLSDPACAWKASLAVHHAANLVSRALTGSLASRYMTSLN